MAEYIEREALIRQREEFWQDGCDHMAVRVTNIMNIPPADVVEVRHGSWVDCKCSVCGEISPTLHLDMENEYKIRETPYCPTCGAKMDGKDGAGNDGKLHHH